MVTFTITIDDELHRLAEARAQEMGMDLQELVEMLLREFLAANA